MIEQAYSELAATSRTAVATTGYDPTIYTVLTPAQTLDSDLERATKLAGATLPPEMNITVGAIQRDLRHEPLSPDRLDDAATMIGYVLAHVESQRPAETVHIPVQLSQTEETALVAARDALVDSDPDGPALRAVRGLLTHALAA